MARISAGEQAARIECGWHPKPVDRELELERKVANLQLALATQRLIGTLVGILAQRYGLGTPQAWELLTRISQGTNVKVRDVARVLVTAFDGELQAEDAELLAIVSRQLPDRQWPAARQDDQPDRSIGDDWG